MFELQNVLNALATIWALVGCMLGLYVLIVLICGIVAGTRKGLGGSKRNEN